MPCKAVLILRHSDGTETSVKATSASGGRWDVEARIHPGKGPLGGTTLAADEAHALFEAGLSAFFVPTDLPTHFQPAADAVPRVCSHIPL